MSIWDDWKLEQEAKRRKPPKPRTPPVKRPITEAELKKLQLLARITPQSGSMDKRFIRQLGDATMDTEISERQADYINILWYKYRRQLGHSDPRPDGYITR